jgi:hypothetical protein
LKANDADTGLFTPHEKLVMVVVNPGRSDPVWVAVTEHGQADALKLLMIKRNNAPAFTRNFTDIARLLGLTGSKLG